MSNVLSTFFRGRGRVLTASLNDLSKVKLREALIIVNRGLVGSICLSKVSVLLNVPAV